MRSSFLCKLFTTFKGLVHKCYIDVKYIKIAEKLFITVLQYLKEFFVSQDEASILLPGLCVFFIMPKSSVLK